MTWIFQSVLPTPWWFSPWKFYRMMLKFGSWLIIYCILPFFKYPFIALCQCRYALLESKCTLISQTVVSAVCYVFSGGLSIMHSHASVKRVQISLYTPWRHVGGVEVWRHSFLTSAVDGGKRSDSRLGRLTYGERILVIHWEGPRDRLDVLETRWNSGPCHDSKPGSASPWPGQMKCMICN